MVGYFAFFFMMSIMNIFRFTPMEVMVEMFLQFCSFIGLVFFIKFKLWKLKELRYIFLFTVLLTTLSIVASIINLGQDIFSAVIAVRHVTKAFSVFIFAPFLMNNRMSLEMLLRRLGLVVWPYAAFVTIVGLMNWTWIYVSPLSGQELVVTGANYDKSLIFLFIIFYLASYFRRGRLLDIAKVAALFLSTQAYDIQRGDMIFVIVLTAILSLKHFKSSRAQKLILISPILIAIVSIVFSFANTEALEGKFEQMLMLLDTEQHDSITDAAVFVRLEEARFAMEGFAASPIIGNGLIRSSVKSQLIGDVYFYASDVGYIGVLYTFGIMGMVPVFFALIWLLKHLRVNYSIVQYTFFLFAVYRFMYSFKDGSMIFTPSLFALCLVFVVTLSLDRGRFVRASASH